MRDPVDHAVLEVGEVPRGADFARLVGGGGQCCARSAVLDDDVGMGMVCPFSLVGRVAGRGRTGTLRLPVWGAKENEALAMVRMNVRLFRYSKARRSYMPTQWKLVILESPFRPVGATSEERQRDGDMKVDYARRCMRDCLLRGEAPMVSHLLYTQPNVLSDDDPKERELGIAAGLAWGREADLTVVYTDLDISSGMKHGIALAEATGRPVEYRTLPNWRRP